MTVRSAAGGQLGDAVGLGRGGEGSHRGPLHRSPGGRREEVKPQCSFTQHFSGSFVLMYEFSE